MTRRCPRLAELLALTPFSLGCLEAAATGADNFDYRRSGANVREELINTSHHQENCSRIDTLDEGAPVVHAVKDSAANQIQVGDKLVAVDDRCPTNDGN